MKIKRFAAIFAALVMCVACVVPAFAANYTPIYGTTTTLTKQLIMPDDAEVPVVAFPFTVSAGTAVAPSSTTMQVWAGPNPELVTVNGTAQTGTVSFGPGDATQTGSPAGQGQVYAEKNIVLDFSAVQFSEPGVYRYIVTEGANNNPAVTNDPISTHTVDVYVYDNNGSLVVQQYVVYQGTITAAPNADGTAITGSVKNACYVNTYAASGLTVAKTVTGNQGSRDQYFQFTIDITGLAAGTVVTVDNQNMEAAPLANAATPYTAADMATANGRDDDANTAGIQLVANNAGEIHYTVYLKHGQSVTINGIPVGATVGYTENDANMYGYTTTNGSASTTMPATALSYTVTNDRGGNVPTGIIATMSVGATIIAAAAAGFVVVNRKKSSDED